MIEVIDYSGIPDASTGMRIIIPKTDLPAFKQMVQRGVNLWPDAPASIKSAADIITNGAEMQPYAQLSGENK